jgi:hypothetical protein
VKFVVLRTCAVFDVGTINAVACTTSASGLGDEGRINFVWVENVKCLLMILEVEGRPRACLRAGQTGRPVMKLLEEERGDGGWELRKSKSLSLSSLLLLLVGWLFSMNSFPFL